MTCFVLAGGVGERLCPLTRTSPKPLLPFGGVYRLLDFTLSNVANSRLERAHVLSQYLKDDIGDYLRGYWEHARARPTRFIHQPPARGKRYRSTTDAVVQNIDLVRADSDLILVLSADHVYRMDYRKLLDYHVRHGGGVTVASVPVHLDRAGELGVISADAAGRVVGFAEKPREPQPSVARGDHALASMGIYVFNRGMFLQAVADLRDLTPELDFGKDLVPYLVGDPQVSTYRVANEEGDSFYWRDVGTLETYYESNMELLAGEPPFEMFDSAWPVRSCEYPSSGYGSLKPNSGPWVGSIVSSSCLLGACSIERSILAPGVTVEDGADVYRSILLSGARVGRGAAVRNAIVDAYGEIRAGDEIGYRSALAAWPPLSWRSSSSRSP